MCKMTEKLSNKSSKEGSKFKLYNIKNGCCSILFRMKIDERFPQGKGWLCLSLASPLLFLTHRFLAPCCALSSAKKTVLELNG